MAAENRGVAYIKPGVVEIQSIPFPKLIDPTNRKKAEHGALLKIVSTNICGSDQHMVRGRTTAPAGLILGHEITGEVIETGRDVLFVKKGDIVSVPFNIACGRCRNCNEGRTGICLTVNPARPGAAYGYVDMGGWVGGQAEYVMVPYADFNLLKFPDRDEAMAKIKDLTLLSDIFPTGYHGAVTAGVGPGMIVYVAGAGQAKSFGCETIDLTKDATLAQQIEQIVGVPEVDCSVDCVGFEAHGQGKDAKVERPATVLNSIMEVTRAGGQLGIPGLYVTGDPGGVDENAKIGMLGIRIGLGWAKSHSFHTGQCPVKKYNRQLMQCILHDKIKIAKAVNVQTITLDDAPRGYKDFDKGAAKKYVIDPHKMIKAA
jgi:glutathione-independent formaldehyde dehydrogenase